MKSPKEGGRKKEELLSTEEEEATKPNEKRLLKISRPSISA